MDSKGMTPATETQPGPPAIGAAQLRLLEKLCTACAVSGDEGEVRKIVLEQIRPHVDDVSVDALGNVLAVKAGSGDHRLKVMLAAHMDEVGFILVSDEEDGFFRFDNVGGIDVRQLPGKPVWIGSEHVYGVIGAKPIHLTTEDERNHSITLDSLRIDVGSGNHGVKVGDRATFATPFSRIGPSICAKALDDRLGVATLIELVKHAPPNIDLLAAFTVQEEVGLRGAQVVAYTMNPDVAIVLDSTPANDLPSWDGLENTRYNTRLDAGPAIYIADSATLSDPRLVRFLMETAESAGLPYQIRQPGGGGTDAGAIHKQRAGIPSISVSVPGRYPHTAASIARLVDWKNTLALVYTALCHISPDLLLPDR
jgi:putative aminopeptidase FrvX